MPKTLPPLTQRCEACTHEEVDGEAQKRDEGSGGDERAGVEGAPISDSCIVTGKDALEGREDEQVEGKGVGEKVGVEEVVKVG